MWIAVLGRYLAAPVHADKVIPAPVRSQSPSRTQTGVRPWQSWRGRVVHPGITQTAEFLHHRRHEKTFRCVGSSAGLRWREGDDERVHKHGVCPSCLSRLRSTGRVQRLAHQMMRRPADPWRRRELTDIFSISTKDKIIYGRTGQHHLYLNFSPNH